MILGCQVIFISPPSAPNIIIPLASPPSSLLEARGRKGAFLCSIEAEEFLLSNHFSLLSGWGEITRLVFKAKASMGL